ncbi:hypothetical protein OBBRIDRAFT_791727 [Obba rivulosa]|uniref:Uncharacterized protein n=1 Tax=Obba rivulosa TaxID=1052685 RepID=A0A8E2DN34_9APHY|nr:hypothetical protein OBBRIDRAFT_791727 [Obba rivulosa]
MPPLASRAKPAGAKKSGAKLKPPPDVKSSLPPPPEPVSRRIALSSSYTGSPPNQDPPPTSRRPSSSSSYKSRPIENFVADRVTNEDVSDGGRGVSNPYDGEAGSEMSTSAISGRSEHFTANAQDPHSRSSEGIRELSPPRGAGKSFRAGIAYRRRRAIIESVLKESPSPSSWCSAVSDS